MMTMHMSGLTAEYMRTSAGKGRVVHRSRLAFMPGDKRQDGQHAVRWAALEAAGSCTQEH